MAAENSPAPRTLNGREAWHTDTATTSSAGAWSGMIVTTIAAHRGATGAARVSNPGGARLSLRATRMKTATGPGVDRHRGGPGMTTIRERQAAAQPGARVSPAHGMTSRRRQRRAEDRRWQRLCPKAGNNRPFFRFRRQSRGEVWPHNQQRRPECTGIRTTASTILTRDAVGTVTGKVTPKQPSGAVTAAMRPTTAHGPRAVVEVGATVAKAVGSRTQRATG
jgi:hypothetical protein